MRFADTSTSGSACARQQAVDEPSAQARQAPIVIERAPHGGGAKVLRLIGSLCLCASAALPAWGCGTAAPVTKIVGGKTIETRAVSPQAYEHATRALVYQEQGRLEDAALELQRALPFDDEAPELRARLAELFLRLGRVEDAAAEVEKSLAVDSTVPGLVADAHVRRARHDTGGEITALRHAVELADNPDESEAAEAAHLDLAEAQIGVLDVAGAYETLRKLCGLSSTTLTGRMRLAAVAWALGKYQAAANALHELLEEEPADLDAILLLAELQAATGLIAEAKASFSNALERAESPLVIAEAYAGWLARRGDVAEAQKLADRFARPEAEAGDAELRSRLERAARRPARSRAIAGAALKRGEAPGRMLILSGEATEDLGDAAGALKSYLAVDMAAPELVEARQRAAAVLRDDGRTGEAMRVLEEALATQAAARPNAREELIIAMSQVDEKRGDAAQAARRLDDALARQPGARLALARAAVEERRGDWRRALGIAESVLEQDARNAAALNFVGFVAADHGYELPRAVKRLEAAVALEPGNGAIIDSLGWALFRAGDLDRGGGLIEQAARLEPGDPEILAHLGDLYAKRSDRRLAVETYRDALTRKPPERLKHDLEDKVRELEATSAAGR